TSHHRDNHRDNGSRGIPKPPRQKFDNYTPLVASITSRTSDENSAEIFGFSGFFRVKAVKQPVRTAP
ncbi:hypothetical protein PIB30_109728, partial [Stylosanthes scabra]|nr:hypothetical protein [Stylosanthes scabra]